MARFVHAGAPALTVERAAGAEDCPDRAGLAARVEAIRGSVDPDATAYRVTFARGPRGYSAAIRAATDGATERNLEAREANCSALAHATAVALAVLMDANGAEQRDAAAKSSEETTPASMPVQPPVPKSAAVDAIRVTPTEHPAAVRIEPLLSAGAAVLVGVLRPAALAFVADAGIAGTHFRGTLGALWAAPQTIEIGPGSARENLISGSLRICYAPAPRASVRIDFCSGAFVGAATAEARGFTTNERHTEVFLAFPAEVALSLRSGFIGGQLGMAALVPLPPNEFDVEGLGPTYRPAPVAGMLSLRVAFEPMR